MGITVKHRGAADGLTGAERDITGRSYDVTVIGGDVYKRQGKPDGTFRPDSEITRAEIVAILVRLYDLNSDDMVLFDDTKDHWASGYISIAASLGYVNGFDAKHFGPDDQLTREQMAVMTARIAELQEDTSGGNPVPFTDKDRISSWALSAVTSVFQNGVISGYPDGTFRPSAKITLSLIHIYRSHG